MYGYERNSWKAGEDLYIRDINFDISRKFSKGFKAKYAFFHFDFNTLATPVTTDYKGIVNANVHVVETQVRIKKGHSLRTELQALFTGTDMKEVRRRNEAGQTRQGRLGHGAREYSVSPHWFFSVLDQYNFGNPNPDNAFTICTALSAASKAPTASRLATENGAKGSSALVASAEQCLRPTVSKSPLQAVSDDPHLYTVHSLFGCKRPSHHRL